MTKKFYNMVYKADHPSQYGGGKDGMPSRTAILKRDTESWLNLTGLASKSDSQLLEIGCGMAYLSDIHPGWHGAEYSKTAVQRAKDDRSVKNIFEADAQHLPFQDSTFDGVFTWAALEHVSAPELAFQEIHRVLRGGGYGLIAPAWNCRPWTVKKLEDRAYSDLAVLERFEKVLIPLRESLIVRALIALPLRIWGEVLMHMGETQPLRYQTLSPRWDLIEKYGHVSDDDATASIDPHAGIIFFKSRGYQIISHPTAKSRLLARHEPLIVQKPVI